MKRQAKRGYFKSKKDGYYWSFAITEAGLNAGNWAVNHAVGIDEDVEKYILWKVKQKELNELEISGLQNKAELQKVERDFKAEMMENDVLRLEQMQKNLKTEEDLEKKRLENKIKTFQDGTQAQQDAQQELDLFLKESANAQTKLEKDLAVAKENQLKQTLGNIAGIVGQNSKFGKAIAIVQALQDTYAGANKALAQGGLFGFVGAAAVIAAGIANVKQIAGRTMFR